MNINRKILAIGALLLITGIITAVMSFDPSQILQYIFIGISVTIGVTAFTIGRQAKYNFVRSKYYLWIGFILFVLAISLSIWATTLVTFIIVLGFFLLVLGIIEFVFAQQILTYEEPVPWALLGVKLAGHCNGKWRSLDIDHGRNKCQCSTSFFGRIVSFSGISVYPGE